MTNIYWLNPVSGNFDTATNWSTDSVPGSGDNAYLNASGTTPYTVSVMTSQTVGRLDLAATATLAVTAVGVRFGAPGLTNAGTISIGNGVTLAPEVGIVNSGLIELNGNAKSTEIYVGGNSNLSLTGGGTVALSDSSANVVETSYRNGAPTSIYDIDNTIAGAGQLGNGQTQDLARLIHADEAAPSFGTG